MSNQKNTWPRMSFFTPGTKISNFERPEVGEISKEEKKAISLARKYFDEFNSSCKNESKHVLAFIRSGETNIPFTEFKGEELKARMAVGQCLHYTAAGILAVQLEEKLREIQDDSD